MDLNRRTARLRSQVRRWCPAVLAALGALGGGDAEAAAPFRPLRRPPIISIARSEGEARNTAFRIAARDSRIDEIRELLGKGVDIDSASEEGMTALMYASLHCHADAVKVLLDAKAKANLQDKKGRTALIYAARGACLPVARMLLNTPGIRWRHRDMMNRSAYDYAQSAGALEVGGTAAAIRKLIRAKARSTEEVRDKR